MIRHNFFDFNYDYLRFDTTWAFEWDVEKEGNGTIQFDPFTRAIDGEAGNNLVWRFNAEGGPNGETIITHSQYEWQQDNPLLEYYGTVEDGTVGDGTGPNEYTNSWDFGGPVPGRDPLSPHPDNLTRYLSPFGSTGMMTMTNTVETVIIDTVPPRFVSDAGTEYIMIATPDDKNKSGEIREDLSREVELVFQDQAGLDFKYFTLTVPGYDNGHNGIIYHYDREHEVQEVFDDKVIAKKSMKVYSDGFNTYKIKFKMNFVSKELQDKLSENGLVIKVWDKAANHTSYQFGGPESDIRVNDKKWIFIDASRALDEFEPLVIKFTDINPPSGILESSVEGEAWVTIYNPNDELWVLGMNSIVEQLSEISNGWINPSTLTDQWVDPELGDISGYEKTGMVRFKIEHVNKSGLTEVEAWCKTGLAKFDDILKTVTYAKNAISWMVMDPEGRRYNLKPYVPNYLKNTDYYDFIKFFELYLNTVYTNMTRGTNISVLEKIAEIGDFLDIDKIENYLVREYARHRGTEFSIDLETMLNMNLGFFNPGVIASRDEDDVLDIVKYALKNLPMYNQLKGTDKGMIMALKMFSFVCKLVPLWVKMEPQVEDNPNFIEEDRLYSFTGYFMTSRFNLEVDATNCDFKDFNDNIDAFIRFIKSIKPITRILNLIKYTIISNADVQIAMDTANTQKTEGGYKDYVLIYNYADIQEMAKRSRLNESTGHVERLWFGFRPSNTSTIDGENVPNMYTTLGTLLEKYRGKFKFTYKARSKTIGLRYWVYDESTQEMNNSLIWFTQCDPSGLDDRINEAFVQLTGYDEAYVASLTTPAQRANYNAAKTNFAKDYKVLQAKINESVDVEKEFSLKNVKPMLLDSGFFFVPYEGSVETYLASIFKYMFVENACLEFFNKWSKVSIGDPWLYIDTEHGGSRIDDTVEVKFSHIPGTELYTFE